MSQISAAAVKALRDPTDMPMMDCKAALTDANGDMVSWVAGCLRSRLPAMLRRAGAPDLARDLDVDAAVTALTTELERRSGGEQHGQAG